MTLETSSFLMASLCKPDWDIFLDTVRNQTVAPTQIVVVVDRATDEDERSAMQEKHPDVDFVFNERNLGVAMATNRGLRRCHGDVVFRLDDDDACHPKRVELQLKALNETGAEITVSYGRGINDRPHTDFDNETGWLIDCPTTDRSLKTALLRRNVIIHSSVAMRRDALERLGGYDESFKYALDYALYLNAMKNKMAFTVVTEALVTRFYFSESITVGKRKQQMMFSAAARLLYAAHENEPFDFLRVMWQRSWLLAFPNWLRNVRRHVFTLVGRGA